MATTITSTEFRRSTFRDLSEAVKKGSVSITSGGKLAYVLLSYKEYCRLTGSKTPASDVATR
jgi:prevent-host-death family protein